MTDKELQDFIEHGENGFVEFAMVFGEGWAKHAIEIAKELRARLAQPEPDAAYGYASRLAEAIYQKHYRQDSPEWKPLDDTLGVLTQIDNMTCRLVKAQPEPEPQEAIAKWIKTNTEHRQWYICPKCNHQTPRFKDEWQGLTEEDKIEIQLLKWWDFEDTFDLDGYTRAIEAKLKEKNSA